MSIGRGKRSRRRYRLYKKLLKKKNKMGASNSSSQNLKFYSLKAKASDSETPAFVHTEKVNGTWTETGRYDTISGRLDGAEIKQKEYQGVKFNVFSLTISDDQETSKVELTHNSITHNLINSLA